MDSIKKFLSRPTSKERRENETRLLELSNKNNGILDYKSLGELFRDHTVDSSDDEENIREVYLEEVLPQNEDRNVRTLTPEILIDHSGAGHRSRDRTRNTNTLHTRDNSESQHKELQLVPRDKLLTVTDATKLFERMFHEHTDCDVQQIVSLPKLKKFGQGGGSKCIREISKVLYTLKPIDDVSNIESYLNILNRTINFLGLDLSEEDYMVVIISKLPEKIHGSLDLTNLQSFLNSLKIFGSFQSKASIKRKLIALANFKFASSQEMLMTIVPLLGKIESEEQKLDLLSSIVLNNMPGYLARRLEEKLERKYPPFSLQDVHNFVANNKADIDFHLNKYKAGKKDTKFHNFSSGAQHLHDISQGVRPKTQLHGGEVPNVFLNYNGRRYEKYRQKCTKCEGSNWHQEGTCHLKCTRCFRIGHSAETCTARCRLCGSKIHLAVDCSKYPNIEPTQIPCEYCEKAYGTKLFHPEGLCKNK